ncbi:hypothetical protein GALMADRAFT_267633 [Galerina marginata CBS 339.88]|uniref:Membrane fraction protein n=1 Tax=Galerina marginata (strain CBS 339.88) TaxID=685588 RepID=A0A067T9N0_GALM3|nr:hypothetical protein GALMADRAFT_267633 [Galerina marginata CBS 339.88]
MSSPSAEFTAPSVPLPTRRDTSTMAEKNSVWLINAPENGRLPTAATECLRRERSDEVCCKELIHDERSLINPDVVRDVIIGLSDGLTVPFALTAGLSSLGQSRLVVLGGIAELIAGAISMGIGGFLASQAERDHYRYLRHKTAERVHNSCAGEMEREVSEVLGPVGVDNNTSHAVAKRLLEVEDDGTGSAGLADRRADLESSKKTQSAKEVGLTTFLLKFGQGLEEIPNQRMYVSAFTIGLGYLLGGIIPLIPYFAIPKAHIALIYSSVITGIILLAFGAAKARVTGAARNPAGYVWGAVSTLMVGGLAAASAFGIARAVGGVDH